MLIHIFKRRIDAVAVEEKFLNPKFVSVICAFCLHQYNEIKCVNRCVIVYRLIITGLELSPTQELPKYYFI